MTNIELAVKYAWSLLSRDIPYAWGGDNPFKGFDCSGAVVEILQAVGILKHGEDYSAAGLKERFAEAAGPGPGILVFWHRHGHPEHIVHVGMCLDDLRFIEWGGGNSTVHGLEDSRRKGAWGRVRTLPWRADLAGYSDPFIGER